MIPSPVLRGLQHAAASSCEPTAPLTPQETFLRVFLGIACLLLAALFSGLTLGVMGLDLNELEIIRSAGTEDEKRDAALIMPVRSKGNLLLCTLVLGNVAVTSLESILLAGMTDGLTGFLLSTVLVVVFGEIIPQAICARYAMRIGAQALPILNFFLTAFYPAAKPLAMVLDYFLGEEKGMSYNKAKLQKLLAMHVATHDLAASEAAIITNALGYRSKTVQDVCTPSAEVFFLRASDRLNEELLTEIFQMGYSRVPVLDATGERVVGVLHAKDLVLIQPSSANQPVISLVHHFGREKFNSVYGTELLEDVMRKFTSTKEPFAMVYTARPAAHSPGGVTTCISGLITMQDVLREIVGDEIDRAEGPQGVGVGGAGAARLQQAAAQASEAADVAQAALRAEQREQQLSRLQQQRRPGFSGSADLLESDNGMTAQQLRAMAAHLVTNVTAFARLSVGVEAVAAMLKTCRVQDYQGPPSAPLVGLGSSSGGGGSSSGSSSSSSSSSSGSSSSGSSSGSGSGAGSEEGGALPSPITLPTMLYQRGHLTDWCCVILSGTVSLRSGADAVHSQAGAWDVLAERVLLLEEQDAPTYRVDFDAQPASRIAHVLCITRAAYNSLCHGHRAKAGAASASASSASSTGTASASSHAGRAMPASPLHPLPALLPHRKLSSTRAAGAQLGSPTTGASPWPGQP